MTKDWHFGTTYPPLLVNVVCERPLMELFILQWIFMISRGSSSGLPKLSLYTMCNDMNFRFLTLNCSMILSYCHNGVHMVFGFLGIITTKNITCSVNLAVQSMHCEFLDYWNTQKKCLWDLTIFFICIWWRDSENMKKKLNSHDGFLSYLQNSTANLAHLAAHFCPTLVCPQKATVRIQFLSYFWNPLIK